MSDDDRPVRFKVAWPSSVCLQYSIKRSQSKVKGKSSVDSSNFLGEHADRAG